MLTVSRLALLQGIIGYIFINKCVMILTLIHDVQNLAFLVSIREIYTCPQLPHLSSGTQSTSDLDLHVPDLHPRGRIKLSFTVHPPKRNSMLHIRVGSTLTFRSTPRCTRVDLGRSPPHRNPTAWYETECTYCSSRLQSQVIPTCWCWQLHF